MGKHRREMIRNSYAPNERNLNPHSEETLVIEKSQRREANYRKVRNQVWHRFMKVYKPIFKAQRISHWKRLFEVYGRVGMPFGYWKMWILEGRIGPIEDEDKVEQHPT